MGVWKLANKIGKRPHVMDHEKEQMIDYRFHVVQYVLLI